MPDALGDELLRQRFDHEHFFARRAERFLKRWPRLHPQVGEQAFGVRIFAADAYHFFEQQPRIVEFSVCNFEFNERPDVTRLCTENKIQPFGVFLHERLIFQRQGDAVHT